MPTDHPPAFRRCLLLLAAAALAAPAPAWAEEAPSLTLDSALRTAIGRNPAVREQESVVEQDAGQLMQASGAFDWNVTASLGAQRVRTPELGPFGTVPVSDSTQLTYSLGVGKLFRNGVSIEPNLEAGTSRVLPGAAPTVGSSQVGFVIVVPLLRGLGVDDTGAVEAAERGDVKVAQLLYQNALASQALATATAYWASRAADEEFAVQSDVEKAAARLVNSTKALVDSSVFPPAFLLQAQANLRAKETTRIEAELSAKSARIALGQALGLSAQEIDETPGPSEEFPAVAPMIVIDAPAKAAVVREALASRYDMIASRESLVPLRILERQARLELRPQLNLTLNEGYSGLSTGPGLAGPLNHNVTGLNSIAGLSLAWPVNNTFQRGLLRQQEGDLKEGEAQTELLSQSVAGYAILAVEQVRLLSDEVRASSDTVAIAKKAVSAQQDRIRMGEGTILDEVTLENLEADARIDLIEAEAQYATAVAQLRFAVGQVFDRPAPTASSFSLTNLARLPNLDAINPAAR
ncbi:MAG TPA: TolC family protein [Opitutaceae bacterium]|jgi:outer membrane protein TolC